MIENKRKSRKFYSVKEWEEKGRRLYGDKRRHWKFRCPMCKTVQSGQDFIDTGMSLEASQECAGFSCIGRVNGKGAKFFALLGTDGKKGSKKMTVGCDWKLSGLFSMHEAAILIDGEYTAIFEFADELKGDDEQ